MNNTITSTRDISKIDEIQLDEHEEGACCVGCKIEGFIADLKKSTHGNDSELGHRFQRTLDSFNYEQKLRNQPRVRGC